MNTANFAVITSGDMTGNINSTPVELNQTDTVSFQAVWTGTPVGNIKVQVSNDLGPSTNGLLTGNGAITHWDDIPGTQQPVSGAGSFFWSINENIGSKWARVVYTASSSSGTLNARAIKKDF